MKHKDNANQSSKKIKGQSRMHNAKTLATFT